MVFLSDRPSKFSKAIIAHLCTKKRSLDGQVGRSHNLGNSYNLRSG
ncbi:hypothetical protein LC607_29605 [Nostoc sp. CHAB 5824]|nr:hypothetical protein [Nostoc sp. CHAB 5824]